MREIFDMVPPCCSTSLVALAVLLNVLQTYPTLDSVSLLLFSRLKVPNPKRLRKEDVLELKEPVLVDRVREVIEPFIDAVSPLELTGGVSIY